MPLAFHWNSNEVERLLCSIAKVSVVSVSLPFSAIISVLVGLDCSFEFYLGLVYWDSRRFYDNLDFEL